MVKLEKAKVIHTIKNNPGLLEKYSVTKLGLFGSVARSDNSAKSDIDFLVSFRQANFDNYMGFLYALRKTLSTKKIDLVCLDAIQENRKVHIMKDIVWLAK